MRRHCRIGSVGKPELLKAGLRHEGLRIERHFREEAVDQQLAHLVARDRDLQATADQLRSTAGQCQRPFVWRVVGHQDFFGLPTTPDEDAPLPRFEMPVSLESSLDVMCQREVTVVAAEDQVIPNRHAMELHGATFTLLHADQCEVARPAADIAHQNLLTGRHEVTPVRRVLVDPRIEGRLRLFDQNDARQPRLLRGLHGQLASHLIERRGEREDKVLLRQRMLGKLRVPRFSRVLQIPRADGDRRESFDILSPLPRQEVGRSIDSRMTEPRLRRRDHPTGDERPVVAREVTDDDCRSVRDIAPRHSC